MLLVVLGSLGLLALSPAITGNLTEIPENDINQIVLYLIEILKIALGYLVGRGFRLFFNT